MQYRDLDKNRVLLFQIVFPLFVFFIPISPTLKSIFFVCSIASVVCTRSSWPFIRKAYSSLWGVAACLFFAYILLACLWSEAPYSMRWAVVGKYVKVLYLPLLAVAFMHPKVRLWSINSYLAAMALTSVLSIIKAILRAYDILLEVDAGEIFYNHIITGFMMVFAVYLSGLFIFKYRGRLRIVYALLFVLMSCQVLFINTGRTGYILYLLLMGLLFVQKMSFKHTVLGFGVLITVLALVYQVSPVLRVGMQSLSADIEAMQHNQNNNSLGYRFQFHHYAHSLMEEHPLIGIGTGGFKYRFSQDNPIPAWGPELTDPHSQYWMTMAEQGLTGLILLLGFLASLLINVWRLKETRPILLGILLAFFVCSFSDTILCFSTAGYLLVVFSALCFGELLTATVKGHSYQGTAVFGAS